MILNKYLLILGIIDTLNEWNEKLNKFSAEHLDNVGVGTIIVVVLVAIAILGIQSLNKK